MTTNGYRGLKSVLRAAVLCATLFSASEAGTVESAVSLCKKGDGRQCFLAGAIYFTGREVPKDLKLAYFYYERACSLEVAEGCTELGNLYYGGMGVSQNDREALRLYARACELSDGTGCRYLGDMHFLGQGVEHNLSSAEQYYKKACSKGDRNGCRQIDLLSGKAAPVNDDEDQFVKKMKQYRETKKSWDRSIEETELLDKL